MAELFKKNISLEKLLQSFPFPLPEKNLSKKEKIQKLKKMIDDNEYELDAKLLAEKILDDTRTILK